MTIPTQLPFLIEEPFAVYHAHAKDHLSSHQLADFRKSPRLYHRKRMGLIPDDDRPAFQLGRAAHSLILEGLLKFESQYAVGGPVNPKTGAPYGQNTKAWTDWEESVGKPVITDSQFEVITRMTEAVRMHAVAAELLVHGNPELVVRADYCNMPCQIRMDWFDEAVGIVDLKTCDDLSWFEADARRYGYIHQMAFYRAVLAFRTNTFVPVHIVAVEKKEPYRCGVWRVTPEALTAAQRENQAAIARLRTCLADEHWPTGYEEVRSLELA
jgi:hypothetical protein